MRETTKLVLVLLCVGLALSAAAGDEVVDQTSVSVIDQIVEWVTDVVSELVGSEGPKETEPQQEIGAGPDPHG